MKHEPVVIDWTKTRNKGVRSCDGRSVGLVVAEMKEDHFIVESTSARKKYHIPKDKVEAFDGSKLKLLLTLKEVFDYGTDI